MSKDDFHSVKKQFDLTGKICVITGAAGFLGKQFANAIAEMGGHPVLWDVDSDLVEKVSESISAKWGVCDWDVVDITDIQSIKKTADSIIKKYNKIDVLINNAALTKYGCDKDKDVFFAPFEEEYHSVWKAGLETNLTGVANCCHIIGPLMVKEGRGSIINIGSDVGVVSPDQRIYEKDPSTNYSGVDFNTPAFYSVSKAGVIHLTKHLATLWGMKNVRVNSFSPAGVNRGHDPGFVNKLVERIPLGRMARENEYNAAIIFLASNASSFMTGHNLIMDGGRTVW